LLKIKNFVFIVSLKLSFTRDNARSEGERRAYRERSRAAEAGVEPEAIRFLKSFTVFNADQCGDLPADLAPPSEPIAENLILPQTKAPIHAIGADIRIGRSSAFYLPSADYIKVPPPPAFFEPINWHRTVFHELGHRGHKLLKSLNSFWVKL
jgi:antirestriction protein ArdC